MKKIIALMMVLPLMLCVCGCSKKVDEKSKTDTTTAQSETAPASEAPSDYAQYEPVTQPETVSIKPLDQPVMVPDFTPICQLPEFPTGCEITSLTMVLRYYGFEVDKRELADNHLETGEVGATNFYKAFVGKPSDGASYGCYAPVIEQTANSYLLSKGSGLKAKAMNGVDFSSVLKYIDASIPVVIWGTLECQPGYQSVTWTVDGEDLTWITPEHCMVLVGYDNDSVYVADPMTGEILNYEMSLFIQCFQTLYSQIVVIQ